MRIVMISTRSGEFKDIKYLRGEKMPENFSFR